MRSAYLFIDGASINQKAQSEKKKEGKKKRKLTMISVQASGKQTRYTICLCCSRPSIRSHLGVGVSGGVAAAVAGGGGACLPACPPDCPPASLPRARRPSARRRL